MEKNKPTEDDGIIYDYELDWKPCNSGNVKRIYFENAKRGSLFRVINFNDQTVTFSDVERVEKITDINKVLVKEDNPEENKNKFQSLVNRIVDEIKPITMPYRPDRLICYIEAFPGFDENYEDTVGILYFRDLIEDEMISCKRFFRIHPIGSNVRYEEINFNIYNDVKGKWMKRCEDNVDKT